MLLYHKDDKAKHSVASECVLLKFTLSTHVRVNTFLVSDTLKAHGPTVKSQQM